MEIKLAGRKKQICSGCKNKGSDHSVKTSPASLTINNSALMIIHAIIQDITVYYNVVWYKVVVSYTSQYTFTLVDPDIIYNICQCKIQSYWVNTSAGTTFCHKISLLPEFCKTSHVPATVMGMRSHVSKLYYWKVTQITYIYYWIHIYLWHVFQGLFTVRHCLRTLFTAINRTDFMKVGIKLCLHHPDCRMLAVARKTPETCHTATSS